MRYEAKGGAKFGWGKAFGPLATLSVTSSELVIEASFLGEQRFSPADVVEVRAVGSFFSGRRVQVVHVRTDRPELVEFWPRGSAEAVRDAIFEVGFEGKASAADLPEPIGFPFRWSFAAAVLLLFVAAFFADRALQLGVVHGPCASATMALVFVGSFAIRKPGWLQRMALTEPRALETIRSWLDLVAVVGGLSTLVGWGGLLLAWAR
ncbi:MAG: hypothetical protein R3B99_06865 [Polyangiales bacterium]|nr:hypothetical protein [Myxococcales bacterium]